MSEIKPETTSSSTSTSTSTPTSTSPSTVSTSSSTSDPAIAPLVAPPTKYQKRKKVIYNGREIYSWEQELDEVSIYIDPPKGITSKQIECTIHETSMILGIKGNPPYLKDEFVSPVVVKESFWTMEDGQIHITLSKAKIGETWPSVFKGHGELNAVEAQQEQQKLLLERFQREHPGFDFSNATFSGQAPDPRSFMGGIDRTKIR